MQLPSGAAGEERKVPPSKCLTEDKISAHAPLILISITPAPLLLRDLPSPDPRSVVFCHVCSPLRYRSLDFWPAPLRFPLHRLTPRAGTGGASVQGPGRVRARSRYSCSVNFLNLMTLCVDSKVLWRFAYTVYNRSA